MKSKQIGRDRDESSHFSQLLSQTFQTENQFTPGTYTAIVITDITDKNFVIVKSNLGSGVIDKTELVDAGGELLVGKGEKIQAFYLTDKNGENIFTTMPCGNAKKIVLKSALENKIPLRGKIVKQIKGGYEVQIGDVDAFCPASQIDVGPSSEGSEYNFLIKEINGKQVIASRNACLKLEKEKGKQLLKETLEVGDIVQARVTSLQSFGAFVDLGGMDGLLPISELSFKRINHSREVLKTGQELRLKVLKIDWKAERISLSLRALLENPWQGKMPFQSGDLLEGEIEAIKTFGIFIKLPENFTGLVPNSETGLDRGQKIESRFKKGEKVPVMVRFIDREKEKISLSFKGVKDADSRKEYEKYMKEMNDDNREKISSFGRQLQASLVKDNETKNKSQSSDA